MSIEISRALVHLTRHVELRPGMNGVPDQPQMLRAPFLRVFSGARAGNLSSQSAPFIGIGVQRSRRICGCISAARVSAEEIRSLRQGAKMSQAAFARSLNLSVGYISQLERGTKQPQGPALALLNVIRRKGFVAIL